MARSNQNLTECAPFTWINGIVYTSDVSGVTHTIENGASTGCDSIITLNLTINQTDTMVINNGTTLIATEGMESYVWLDCDNGYEVIEGENNHSLDINYSGSFAVQVYDAVCTDTSSCQEVIINSVSNNIYEEKIKLYPNPSNGSFTISADGTIISVKAFDILGELIFEKGNISSREINIENELKSGVYLIEIKTDRGQFKESFIVR